MRQEDLLCRPLKCWATRTKRTLTHTCHPATRTPVFPEKRKVSAVPCMPCPTEIRVVWANTFMSRVHPLRNGLTNGKQVLFSAVLWLVPPKSKAKGGVGCVNCSQFAPSWSPVKRAVLWALRDLSPSVSISASQLYGLRSQVTSLCLSLFILYRTALERKLFWG